VKNLLLQERERLFNLLKGIPYLKPFPSHANFILCEVTSGKDAKKIKVRFAYYCTVQAYALFH
jgi:histidinol-phosphate aminotransferase